MLTNGKSVLIAEITDDFIRHSISIKIKRIVTDVNGTIIADSGVPAALQLKYPLFLFGEFDRQGGYKQGLSFCPPESGSAYLMSFVNGFGTTSANVIGFSGLNQVRAEMLVGDVVSVFTDDIQNPTYFIWIIQQNTNASIASILANSKTTSKDDKFNRMYVESYLYSTRNSNVRQWDEPVHITQVNNLGIPKDNNYNPNIYLPPTQYLSEFLEIKQEFKVDQFLGLNTYILWATSGITFNFKVKRPR